MSDHIGAGHLILLNSLCLADVRNHLASPRLKRLVGGDVFRFHSFNSVHLDGRWVRATPVFNKILCRFVRHGAAGLRRHRGQRPASVRQGRAVAKPEALQIAYGDPTAGYTRGSALNYVCAHQTVIGQQALLQMELAEDRPDVIIGCSGGGSNLAGLAFPFLREQLRNGRPMKFIAAEPAACPTLTGGASRTTMPTAPG